MKAVKILYRSSSKSATASLRSMATYLSNDDLDQGSRSSKGSWFFGVAALLGPSTIRAELFEVDRKWSKYDELVCADCERSTGLL